MGTYILRIPFIVNFVQERENHDAMNENRISNPFCFVRGNFVLFFVSIHSRHLYHLCMDSDYLELIHGFYHVDGDLPLRTADQPEMKEVIKKFFQMRAIVKEKGEDIDNLPVERMKAYEEYWGPYNQVQVDSALHAAKTHEKVVITIAQQSQIQREYVMSQLKGGGATTVTMLYLTIDQDTKLEGMYHREVQEAKGAGTSFSDYVKAWGLDWTHDRDPTKEEWKVLVSAPGKNGNMTNFEPPPSYAKVVDVSSRDEAAMDAIDAVLGLSRSSVCTESYDTIVTKVQAIDAQRNEDTPYNIAVFAEIKKELKEALALAKTEDEKVQIKRRASSMVKFELQNRLSLASTLSDTVLNEDEDSDSDGDSNNKNNKTTKAMKLKKNRRASFIQTGKIE